MVLFLVRGPTFPLGGYGKNSNTVTHGEASLRRGGRAHTTITGQGLFVWTFSLCRRLALPWNTVIEPRATTSEIPSLR